MAVPDQINPPLKTGFPKRKPVLMNRRKCVMEFFATEFRKVDEETTSPEKLRLGYLRVRIKATACQICSSVRMPAQGAMDVPGLPVLMRQNK